MIVNLDFNTFKRVLHEAQTSHIILIRKTNPKKIEEAPDGELMTIEASTEFKMYANANGMTFKCTQYLTHENNEAQIFENTFLKGLKVVEALSVESPTYEITTGGV